MRLFFMLKPVAKTLVVLLFWIFPSKNATGQKGVIEEIIAGLSVTALKNTKAGAKLTAACGTGCVGCCVAATAVYDTLADQLLQIIQGEESREKYTNPYMPTGLPNPGGDSPPDLSDPPRGPSGRPNLGDPDAPSGGEVVKNLPVNPEKIIEHFLGETVDQVRDRVNRELENLKKKGYSLKGSVIQTPRGPIKVKSLESHRGLKAAGFSDLEIAALNSVKQETADLHRNIKKKMQRGLKTGTFVGRSYRQKKQDREDKMQWDQWMKDLFHKEREPTSVVGLSQKYGSDKIGIKSDNIFQMVSRRYQTQRRENHFLPLSGLKGHKFPVTK